MAFFFPPDQLRKEPLSGLLISESVLLFITGKSAKYETMLTYLFPGKTSLQYVCLLSCQPFRVGMVFICIIQHWTPWQDTKQEN